MEVGTVSNNMLSLRRKYPLKTDYINKSIPCKSYNNYYAVSKEFKNISFLAKEEIFESILRPMIVETRIKPLLVRMNGNSSSLVVKAYINYFFADIVRAEIKNSNFIKSCSDVFPDVADINTDVLAALISRAYKNCLFQFLIPEIKQTKSNGNVYARNILERISAPCNSFNFTVKEIIALIGELGPLDSPRKDQYIKKLTTFTDNKVYDITINQAAAEALKNFSS